MPFSNGAPKMDYATSHFAIKSLADSGEIEGMLAGFDTVDSHGDCIRRGAFQKTLAERGNVPLPMLFCHDPQKPIGAWRTWTEKADGLYVKGSLTLASAAAQEAYALAKDGAITGLSIGFRYVRDEVNHRAGFNEVLEVDLLEGSLVPIPSNPTTRITSVKAIGSARDIAEMLQASGLSGRRAKLAAGAAWKALNEEAADDGQAAEILRRSIDRLKASPVHERIRYE